VDPNHPAASDQYTGLSASAPVRTVGRALAQCEPYSGDAILVMHNGGWTYASGVSGRDDPIQEAVIVTVPGIRILGVTPDSSLGVPWISTADNQTLITVRAMDVLIEGFCFWSPAYTGCTGISAMWDGASGYYGENLTVRRCYVYKLDYAIKLDYTWNCRVVNCRFEGMDTAAIHNPSVYGEPDYTTIQDCVFLENLADVGLADCDHCLIETNTFMDVTEAIKITDGDYNTIVTNSIEGDPTGVNNYINLTGGGNNLVGSNLLACTIAQYDTTCSDATSGSWVANQCTNGPTTAPPT
jgi:hypothetical protein